MQANQPAGATLRVALIPHCPGHSSSLQAGRQKFFPSISFSVDASSIDSAKSFLSLRFSSSSAFSLRASEISIPPARSPLVEGCIADAVLPAHLASRQAGSVLLQHLDDLLFGKSALTHVRLP